MFVLGSRFAFYNRGACNISLIKRKGNTMNEIPVTYRTHGKTERGQMMIKPKSVVQIDATRLLTKVADELRLGNEVRLVHGLEKSEAVRFYSMATSDWRIVPVATTLGDFREQMFAGAVVRATTRRGREITQAEHSECIQREKEKEKLRREGVVPTRVVTCPQCGYEFMLTGMKQ